MFIHKGHHLKYGFAMEVMGVFFTEFIPIESTIQNVKKWQGMSTTHYLSLKLFSVYFQVCHNKPSKS